MKQPLTENTPVDAKRYKRWTDVFGAYRSPVTRMSAEEWLGQFDHKDKDMAARILDSVLFFGQSDIAANYRQVLKSLSGWHTAKTNRTGRWFFVAMSSSAGESGDGMIYQFRVANGLDAKAHKEMFIHPSDLVLKKLTAEDTVVLIDDFTGTGTQVCNAWNDPELSYSELVAGAGRVYLVVVAATKTARETIEEKTSLTLAAAHQLDEKDNIFSEKCRHFSKHEKSRLLGYNRRADQTKPKGFGDSGLLIVFFHRCPNNSIPILRVVHNEWNGLFPRHD